MSCCAYQFQKAQHDLHQNPHFSLFLFAIFPYQIADCPLLALPSAIQTRNNPLYYGGPPRDRLQARSRVIRYQKESPMSQIDPLEQPVQQNTPPATSPERERREDPSPRTARTAKYAPRSPGRRPAKRRPRHPSPNPPKPPTSISRSTNNNSPNAQNSTTKLPQTPKPSEPFLQVRQNETK